LDLIFQIIERLVDLADHRAHPVDQPIGHAHQELARRFGARGTLDRLAQIVDRH
jgi:hypothetical protein